MNKKIIFLILFQIYLFSGTVFSQAYQCPSPSSVTCLSGPTQHITNTTSSLNNDWYTSHSAGNSRVGISANNAPGSTGGSLSLYAGINGSNGAFTCYNFQKDHVYRLCYWARNSTGWITNTFGNLNVYAANNNLKDTPNLRTLPNATKQLLDNSYVQSSHFINGNCIYGDDWEYKSITITAHANFDCLWFYCDFKGLPPPNMANMPASFEYTVEVDDIRVDDITNIPPSFSVTASQDPIDGCNNPIGTGQTTLTIIDNNTSTAMASHLRATWIPPVTTANPTGNVVSAAPCKTTTYRIEIYDPSASCGDCTKEVIYHTVNVNQWSDPANISFTALVPCTGDIELDYNDPGTCPGAVYTWVSPDNISYPGKEHSITNGNPITATALHTGEWTLQIQLPNKNCPEEHKFFIKVGSCCWSNPSFTWSGCNPVTFNNTSTGNANLVGVLWNFGDGTTSDQMNPTHTYNNVVVTPPQTTATKTVCLTMIYEDDQGETCCERECLAVEVCPDECAMEADFDVSYIGGPNHTFYFHDLSSGSGGTTSYNFCEYTWNFGDGTPIYKHGPYSTMQHSFVGPGPWFVCVTVKNCTINANGVPIECEDTKCMWVYPPSTLPAPDASTSTQEKTPNPGETLVNMSIDPKTFIVYPNPNQGSFSIDLRDKKGDYNVIVRDIQGREVYNHKHTFKSNSAIKIYLENVTNGIYSVEVINEHEKLIKQIIITR